MGEEWGVREQSMEFAALEEREEEEMRKKQGETQQKKEWEERKRKREEAMERGIEIEEMKGERDRTWPREEKRRRMNL